MDIELILKHVEKSTTFKFDELSSDGSNAERFFCADIVGARRFAQNYGGYPRSEIAEINEAANLETQLSLISSLNDYSPKDNPNAGKSDAEIMLGHKSKYLQAASEQIGWLESQIKRRDDERFLSQQKQAALEKVEKGVETEVNPE